MQQARRDLIIQRPRHRDEATGVFEPRSPARPNPVAIATVGILNIDQTLARFSSTRSTISTKHPCSTSILRWTWLIDH
ncbi:MAG: TrmO family methyltransferase domain-containing protein [Hyphomicrobiaceae bacterium]